MSGLDVRAMVLDHYRYFRDHQSPLSAAFDVQSMTAKWVADAVSDGHEPEWRLDAYRFARELVKAVQARCGPAWPAELTPHQSYWATGRMRPRVTYTCVYGRCKGAHIAAASTAEAERWMDQHAATVPHSCRWSITFRIDYPASTYPSVAYREPKVFDDAPAEVGHAHPESEPCR